MAGKAIRENMEFSFKVYCEEGGNAESTRRRLEKEIGLKLTRKNFKKWIDDNNFDSRRIEIDALRQAGGKVIDTAWVRSVKGLLKLMDKYETYMHGDSFFSAKGKPDNMAVFAYAGIVGQLRLLLRKFDYIKETEKLPDENVKAKTEEILRDIYGIG